MIGRDTVLAELRDQARRVGEHGSRFLLLTGVSGCGRTALVERFAAHHDGPVLRAVGASWETTRDYGIIDQLAPGAVDVPDPVAAAERFARHLAGLAGTVLVVVDDAHWADEASLQTLASTVRHHPRLRLLVVATAVEGDTRVPAGIGALLRRIATVEIPVEPLTAAEVAAVAASFGIVLSPPVADTLCRHTGGRVRYVRELLREVPRRTWSRFDPVLPAPAAVSARVRDLLADCSDAARRFVGAVAVLGPAAAVREAAALAELGDEEVLDAVDEACTAGLAVLTAHGPAEISPADSLVRAAVLEAMGPAAAARAYRRAADLVDDRVRRLRLLVAASFAPDQELADRLDAVAAERAAEGAWAEAASLFTDASRLTEDRLLRERRLTRAVDALIGSGDAFGAAALVPEVESLRETPLRNAVLGYLAIVRGRAAEAEARLDRAWELVNVDRDPDVAALICQRHVLHALVRCRPDELVAWADRAVTLAGPDAPAGIEAAAIRGLGLAARGRVEQAKAAYATLADRVRHGAQAQRVLMGRGWLDLTLDQVDDARAALETAVPTTFSGGSTRISLWARAWLARAQFLAGEWDDSLRTVAEAATLLDRTGIVLAGPLLHWTGATIHALRGQWRQAERQLRRIDAVPQEYELMRLCACLARAQIAEARADAAGVLRALRPLAQGWITTHLDDTGSWPWADLYAHALVQQNRYTEADEFLTRRENRVGLRHSRSERARLAAARGRLLGAQGDLDRAINAFDRALTLLADLPLRYDQARVNFAYGQTLRRAGKRRDADVALSTARELFAGLGAATYVSRCDRELKAGGQPGARADTELTPQEQAVSQLVARGLSNREVAAELYVSTKTVQYHLTRIYAKLGIRSRAELAALWGRAGL